MLNGYGSEQPPPWWPASILLDSPPHASFSGGDPGAILAVEELRQGAIGGFAAGVRAAYLPRSRIRTGQGEASSAMPA